MAGTAFGDVGDVGVKCLLHCVFLVGVARK